MLALPHTNSWGFVVTNQDNGGSGTNVTPGASSVEGSWTEIISDTAVTADLYHGYLSIADGAVASAAKSQFLDFGWDPAGGTSYVSLFENLACGASTMCITTNVTTGVIGGRPFHFPCKIPAGSALAVRVQGADGTAGTVKVIGQFFGKPSRPELVRPAAYCETLGAGANTLGTSFTPGTTAWGSWASLGSPTKKHFWAQCGVQVNNTSMDGETTHVQLAIGDGTNNHIISDFYVGTNTNERISHTMHNGAWEIPAGSTLYIRGNCENGPASGYNATAVLFGG